MPLGDYDQRTLDSFFGAIEPVAEAYKHACFSYFAMKNGNDFELSKGRLLLQGVPMAIRSGHFQSTNVRAGVYQLGDLGMTAKEVIESLMAGSLATPHGELRFPPEQGRSHSIYLNRFHPDGIRSQSRQMHLHIRGERRRYSVSQTDLDWELRAASVPFDGSQDLCNEYSVGTLEGDNLGVDVIAFHLAAVANNSSLIGTKARLSLILVDGLEFTKASIGYRMIAGNAVIKRGIVSGADLSWSKVDSVQRGEFELEVPTGAVMHCFANYAGETQHHYYVSDPSTSQNPLRAVHQTFDSNLQALNEILNKPYGKGQEARDFEVGVAWLLWMLGFTVTHLGGMPKTSNAPDLIAATPQGHFAVIECTTGLLKADNKLALLVERSEKVRKCLATSGNAHLRVLPIVVTTKTRDEVKADLEQAQKLGVLVITREVFADTVNRSHILPNADKIYTEAEEALRRTQSPSGFLDAFSK